MQPNTVVIEPLPESFLDSIDTVREYRAQIEEFAARGALFSINHSGGKDSQLLYAVLLTLVPAEQIVVVHADLGDEVEWLGVKEHIRANIDHPLHIAQAIWAGDNAAKYGEEKYLLDLVDQRGMWPTPARRNCTSDLKRGPIQKVNRRLVQETGRTLVINCMGLRAEESAQRAQAPVLKLDKGQSKAGREVWNFNPIHSATLDQVWEGIELSGQTRHEAYDKGMTRLSCVFCIMASNADLKIAAKHNPVLLAKYSDLEAQIGHTFRNGQTLLEIVTDGDDSDVPFGDELCDTYA